MTVRAAGLAAAALAALLLPAITATAGAQPVTGTGTGTAGQRLTVSQTADLDPEGQTLTVTGTGYDTDKGIYVAFCVKPEPGEMPTPCGGGADTSGASTGSQWISSNPPSYGKDLAAPYGPGGTFTATLRVSALLDDDVDCRVTECVVATRADHTRSTDRSQDVFVPVSFTPVPAGAAGGSDSHTGWLIGGAIAAGAVLLACAGLLRRGRGGSRPGDGDGPGPSGGDGERSEVASNA